MIVKLRTLKDTLKCLKSVEVALKACNLSGYSEAEEAIVKLKSFIEHNITVTTRELDD